MRDNGAAGGKGGGRLAGQHGRRKIPWRDDADDAERFAPHHHLGVWQMAGDAFGVEAFCLLGIPLDEGGGVVDLAKRFLQRLALLQRHQQRQIVLSRYD